MTSSRTPRPTPKRRAAPPDRPDPPEPAGVPSSLTIPPRGSAAQSGRATLDDRVHDHPETSPALTGGDVDADWVAAYATGDESPGGDNPTPGQDAVDEFGQALGVGYSAEEELRGPDRIADRDRHRWELNPSSAEDIADRARLEGKPEDSKGSPAKKR